MRDFNFFLDPDRWIHRVHHSAIIVLAIVYVVPSAFALDPARKISQYAHDRWGYDQGFVGGVISAIKQSGDGYLWIGTDRGLVRFDGLKFSLIQTLMPDGLPIGPVRGLVTDSNGTLWINLEGSRMVTYHDGRFEDPSSKLDLQGLIFTATTNDFQGNVYLSGLGGKTFLYRNGKLETVLSAAQSPGTVISMASTPDGSVWLGTEDNGLYRTRFGETSKIAEGLADHKINCLLASDNGGLWIGTDHGLHLWKGGELIPIGLPSPFRLMRVLTMLRDHDRNVWIGTNQGIMRLSPFGTISSEQADLRPGSEITAIHEDLDGDIWFGGAQGIECLRNGIFTIWSKQDGLPPDRLGAVYVDSSGRTWVAPSSGGLYWIRDGKVGRVTGAGIERDVVYSISGSDDQIWIGRQRGGLTKLSAHGDNFTKQTYTHLDGLAQNSVYSVHVDRAGRVWTGTVSGGLSVLDHGRFTTYSTANGFLSDTVSSVIDGVDGKEWIATSGGLALFSGSHWIFYRSREGLPSSLIRTIYQGTGGVLWISTAGGLAYLSQGQVKVPPVLPDPLRESILGIAEDATGMLWFSTTDHVLRVDRVRLLNGSLSETDIQSYGTEDGLPRTRSLARDRIMVADQLGRIWLSLSSSVCLADPVMNIKTAHPAKARIESISAGGQELAVQSPTKIPAGIDGVSFTFGGANLAAPSRIRFRYKLDGTNQSWSEIVATRQVVFSNLSPGQHVFRLVASNGLGLWNGPETSTSIYVEPSYWQTWWFRLGCVLASLLVVITAYRLRVAQMAERMNVRFQDRLAERTKIAQDLHDTLLQGVLSASMQLDLAEDHTPIDSPAKPLLRRVLQLMNRISEEGRQALKGLRTEPSNTVSLELALSRLGTEFFPDSEISYRVVVQGNPKPLRPAVRDEVYRIGREAVNNAFLHASPRDILVEIDYSHRTFRLSIRDDGCGIDPNIVSRGREDHWGLSGMRERSQRIGADLKLRSRPGSGTEVVLVIPGRIAFHVERKRAKPQWLPRFRHKRPETISDERSPQIHERR